MLQHGQMSFQPRRADSGLVPAGKPAASFAKLPLSFEANQGQTDARVQFLSRGPDYTLFLTCDEAVLELRKSEDRSQNPQARRSKFEIGRSKLASASGIPAPPMQTLAPLSRAFEPPSAKPESRVSAVLRTRLLGSNPTARVTGLDELPGKSNYFIGNDPKKWRTNVPTYARVKYHGVYPGVDVIFYGNQEQLEYDLVVAPGADPSVIALHVAAGLPRDASSTDGGLKPPLRIAPNGELVVRIDGGEVRMYRPLMYQESTGGRREISGSYILKGACDVAFKLGAYDHSRALVIDPVLAYSTYLGGSSVDYGYGIAVDTFGSAYVTGETSSGNFPTTAGAFQTTPAGTSNAFVAKLNPSGSALVYSTYLGGSDSDFGFGISVDSSGHAYVTGLTVSANFPTTAGAFQTSPSGELNAFITKLNPSGSALVYSTYLGGSSVGYAYGIAVDSSGHAYVIGNTQSTNFPTTGGAFQTTLAGDQNAFITELNTSGSAVVYSTYLGGSSFDQGYGIAVDSSGHAYVTGSTDSPNFPTSTGALQASLAGYVNAFVTKLNPRGSALVYSTYLGGKLEDSGQDVAVDSAGHAYVTGTTDSSDFPTTAGAFQTSLAGAENAFITELNPGGSALVYSTYLGGSSADYGYGIAVDTFGSAYVIGLASSANFPTTAGALQTSLTVSEDPFVTKLNPDGTALLYSTYFGGSSGEDHGTGIALDSLGNAYMTGWTQSTNFPTTGGAFQTSLAGPQNTFVAKFKNSPREQIANLQNTVKKLVSAGTLNPGLEELLLAPLNAALAAVNAGRTGGAVSDLDAFIFDVRLLVAIGRLTPTEGQTLINAANSLIAELRG